MHQAGPRVDVLRARIESLARLGGRARREILQHLIHRQRRRDLGALRRVLRQEDADRAVVAAQVALRGRHHLGRVDALGGVAKQEEQPPVALGDVVRQHDTEALRIGQRALGLGFLGPAHPVHLGLGRRGLPQRMLDHVDQPVARALDRVARLHDGAEDNHAWIVQEHRFGEHLRRQAGLDQLVVQPPAGRLAQDVGQGGQCRRIGAAARRNVIADQHDLRVALAAHSDAVLAILRRLDRPLRRQRALGTRNAAERIRHQP